MRARSRRSQGQISRDARNRKLQQANDRAFRAFNDLTIRQHQVYSFWLSALPIEDASSHDKALAAARAK